MHQASKHSEYSASAGAEKGCESREWERGREIVQPVERRDIGTGFSGNDWKYDKFLCSVRSYVTRTRLWPHFWLTSIKYLSKLSMKRQKHRKFRNYRIMSNHGISTEWKPRKFRRYSAVVTLKTLWSKTLHKIQLWCQIYPTQCQRALRIASRNSLTDNRTEIKYRLNIEWRQKPTLQIYCVHVCFHTKS